MTNPDDAIALEIGRLFINNVRLAAVLEQQKNEIDKLKEDTESKSNKRPK